MDVVLVGLPGSGKSVVGRRVANRRADGHLRWVLPTADGVVIRDDIDPALVERAAAGLLAAPSGSPR